MLTSNDTLNSATKYWETTRDALSTTLTSYLDACASLEVILGRGYDPISAKDITSRIDLTLESLQLEMTRQLTQSTSTLARARNIVAPPIQRLPEEVLSEIFLHVMYHPKNRSLPMKKCLRDMYSSRHSLTAVCSSWRKLALARGVFWQLIPACGKLLPRQGIDLAIQRAGDHSSLHLAVLLPKDCIPAHLITVLKNHASRLRILNVESGGVSHISHLVRALFGDDKHGQLSELSLSYSSTTGFTPSESSNSFVLCPKPLDQAPFTRLILSLSILRLSRFQLKWKSVASSDRLVELFIHRLRLRNSGVATATLLSVLSSASGLHELKIIDVQACFNSTESAGLMARPKIVFPKLQFLVLQDLWFNVLEIFLLVIAPGSYHTTLGLTSKAVQLLTSYSNDAYLGVGFDELTEVLSVLKLTDCCSGEIEDNRWRITG